MKLGLRNLTLKFVIFRDFEKIVVKYYVYTKEVLETCERKVTHHFLEKRDRKSGEEKTSILKNLETRKKRKDRDGPPRSDLIITNVMQKLEPACGLNRPTQAVRALMPPRIAFFWTLKKSWSDNPLYTILRASPTF